MPTDYKADLVCVAECEPFLGNRRNRRAAARYFIGVVEEITLNQPAEAVNRISLLKKRKLLDDLRHITPASYNIEFGQERERLLLDERNLIARLIVKMKLFAERKDLAPNVIFFVSVLVVNRELIAPGKYFLFYVKTHIFSQ